SIGTYQIQMVVPSTLTASADTTVTAAQNDFISNIVTLPVGTPTSSESSSSSSSAPSSGFAGWIDSPNAGNGQYSGTVVFGGWALNKTSPMSGVNVYVD